MGQNKKQGWARWWQVAWIYTSEIQRYSQKAGWSMDKGIKRIGMGKILEGNN